MTVRKISRREFLALGGSAMLASTNLSRGGLWTPAARDAVARFAIPLPTPEVLRPVQRDATTDFYEIVQREEVLEILPGRMTKIWGYNGSFPGPTVLARRGRPVVVRHVNQLHVPTVVHLHGGVTPSESDGFPTDYIMPGASRTYVYPNEGRAATLWYHDHAMGQTGKNLYMGLAGLYLLEDEAEASLGLPTGPYDIPLMIQDRLFGDDGSLKYDTFHGLAAKGGTILVNGVPWPRLAVATRKYRLRLVNGSNATPLRIALSSGEPFVLIATDGGLLPQPVIVPSIPLAMAERVEVIVDFSAYPVGTQVVLQNLEHGDVSGRVATEIMRFDVVHRERDTSVVPDRLSDTAPIPREAAVGTRRLVLGGGPKLGLPVTTHWIINGRDFDAEQPLAAPRYGDVEIWHIENRAFLGFAGLVHPVHVHLVNFRILERDGGPPLPHETGWKDTVAVPKGHSVTIIARFEGYRGRYVLHCHNLEHEDHGMMARFDVV